MGKSNAIRQKHIFGVSGLRLSRVLGGGSCSVVYYLFLILKVVLKLSFFRGLGSLRGFFRNCFARCVRTERGTNFLGVSFLSCVGFLLLFLNVFVSNAALFNIMAIPLLLATKKFFCNSTITCLCSTFTLGNITFGTIVFLPPIVVVVLFLVFTSGGSLVYSLCVTQLALPGTFRNSLCSEFGRCSLGCLFLTLKLVSDDLISKLVSIALLGFFRF